MSDLLSSADYARAHNWINYRIGAHSLNELPNSVRRAVRRLEKQQRKELLRQRIPLLA